MGLFASRPASQSGARSKPSGSPARELKAQLRSKTLFVGDSGVGKTSMLASLRGDEFDSGDSLTTMGIEFQLLRSEMAGQELKLQLWDTPAASTGRAHTPRDAYYRGADFVVVAYSIAQRDSFEGVIEYVDKAKHFGPAGVQLVIVGAKQDLEEEKREVSEDEGRALADLHGARYVATSAKTRQGIDELQRVLEELTVTRPPEIAAWEPAAVK